MQRLIKIKMYKVEKRVQIIIPVITCLSIHQVMKGRFVMLSYHNSFIIGRLHADY
jgi:hypothetical protein